MKKDFFASSNFSCASASSNCQKFFDLTGPLQIGGVPTLPSTFQIENKEYIGCMKEFYLDFELLDFTEAVANNGSEAGCGVKREFCRSSPCQHGGMCCGTQFYTFVKYFKNFCHLWLTTTYISTDFMPLHQKIRGLLFYWCLSVRLSLT